LLELNYARELFHDMKKKAMIMKLPTNFEICFSTFLAHP